MEGEGEGGREREREGERERVLYSSTEVVATPWPLTQLPSCYGEVLLQNGPLNDLWSEIYL